MIIFFFSSITTLDWTALDVGCTDAVCSCSEVMKASSLGGDADGLVNLMWQSWSDGTGIEEGKWVQRVHMADQTGQVHWLDLTFSGLVGTSLFLLVV